jgi:nucleotide-binding universal stress UspA family protein
MQGRIAPILVAYSWSPGGRAALAWALREGAYRHQPVRVIHVVEPDNPTATDPTNARGRLASVLAEATNLGRINVLTTGDVLQGTLADRLIGESRGADLLVLGAGAARRFEDPAWRQIWSRVMCPITIARGSVRVPDRRPVLVAVSDQSRALTRTTDEAAHEADLRDVGVFAVLAGAAEVAGGQIGGAQLVVTDLPRQLAGEAGPRDNALRWVLGQGPQCPVLLVPNLERV